MISLPEHLAHYRILAKLGEGGMGVVYKAEDQRLRRPVALKIIRQQNQNAEQRQRLWQEARAAAQVEHPNVCRLYDVVEDKECLFLVMEFLDGESLASRIRREPLTAQDAAQIALNILSALEALHQRGILHRDLKPSNILLSSQGTKLLDFGLAKSMSSLPANEVETIIGVPTEPGVFLGTPQYASPEQLTCRLLDARSDIFSLGAILFEMLTGRAPFSGNSFAEIARSVLDGAPPVLAGSAAISALSRVVSTALAKDPEDRYATAEAMSADLRSTLLMEGIDTQARALPMRRLIVLPFRMLRPDSEIEFLAYSLPEAITVSLGSASDLIVRSSVVAAQYKDPIDLRKIAKEAEVDVVLIGTLLRLGEQLRVTAQLVEAPGGRLVWSYSLQATVRELVELHDDLVRRVVESVAPSVTPPAQQAMWQDRPASAAAYELYLRANELGRQWENLPAAIALYEECTRADASYAPAWARLGRARWLADKYNLGSAEGLRSADDAFRRAFQLNPNLTLAHNLYTALQVDQGRTLDALERLLERTRQRRNDPELFAGLAHVCRYCGLLQPALAAHHEGRRLDPQIATSVMHTYFMLGDYEKAVETGRNDFGYGIALALASLGRVNEAISLLRDKEETKPWRLGRLYLVSLRTLLEGEVAASLEASEELMKATFRDPEGMYYLARQLCYLGRHDHAITMLARAIDKGFFCYSAMVRDPWLDPLRTHTDFTAHLRKAQSLHREAVSRFMAGGGDLLLGM